VGGRNGYGAKLCNIFSTEFIIETNDGDRGKQFRQVRCLHPGAGVCSHLTSLLSQVFTNNMTKHSEPKITTAKSDRDWTRIVFKPDLPKFGMTELT
jgi:DNA topoisomerase-2